MAKFIKKLGVFLAVTMLINVLCYSNYAYAADFELKFELRDDGTWITGYSGNVPEELEIPETINGSTVIGIDDHVFCECSGTEVDIKSVSMPSVTYIGEAAFMNCSSLTDVYMPNVITIYDSAFCECTKLKEIDIPASAVDIGLNPFGRSENLVKFNVSEDNPEYCGIDGMLLSKDTHTLYSYPSANGDVTLPDYITEIADYGMVELWNMKKLYAPGVKEIGVHGMSFCQNLDSNDEWYGLEEVVLPEVEVLGRAAIYQNAALTKISMPKLKVLGPGALAYAMEITELELPEVEIIDKNSLQFCINLRSFEIPATARRVEGSAFIECYGLVDLTVSEDNEYYYSDGSILYSKDKTKLMAFPTARGEFTVPEHVKVIGDSAFYGCYALESVNMPTVVKIESEAFANCKDPFNMFGGVLKSVYMPNVTEIGDYAFIYDKLEDVYMPNVVTIGKAAFSHNTMLTDVNIPNAEHLGDMAFSGALRLENIYAPNVKYLGDSALDGCRSLESLYLPSVEYAGMYAFASCDSLESVTFRNIETIGHTAFLDCTALNDIVFFGDAPKSESDIFARCEQVITLHITSQSSGFDAEVWKNLKKEYFSPISGDVNQDETVNTGDAVSVLRYSASMVDLNVVQNAVAEMNNDGIINTGDAVAILKIVAGM